MSPFPLVSSRIMITWKSKDKSFNKLWSWARVRKNYLRSEWQARESAPSSPAHRCPLSRGPRPRGEENTPLRGRPRPQGLEGAPGARAEGEPEQPGRQVPQAGRSPPSLEAPLDLRQRNQNTAHRLVEGGTRGRQSPAASSPPWLPPAERPAWWVPADALQPPGSPSDQG